MAKALNRNVLQRENDFYQGSGGVSGENRSYGFRPAFLDRQTGDIHLARHADGRPAPFHLLDGLPDQLVLARSESGSVTAVRASVISGFVRQGQFFTREQAAREVADAN